MTCPCRPLCIVRKPGCTEANPTHASKVSVTMLVEAVSGVPLFDGLDKALVQQLLGDASVSFHERRFVLFDAGTPADFFYIVVEGQVKLSALNPDGRESIVEVFPPGTSFGEAAMLIGSDFPLAAEVIEDATLIRVGRRAFIATLRANPVAARTMMAALCRWNRKLAGEINTLKDTEPWQRVAAYLLSLAGDREGEAVIALPFNREILASRMGIRRESLSRVLGRLKHMGVRSVGNEVCIDDLGALRRFCADGG